ncbi:UrcA family protein [Novosphingobium chloroacetimidivorans]|uniref:UrcA family protein n=1 Tax=Novosphingobium chloroacetimidivorans TaxID=1428314 RepID=A0A7W7KA03_9SPHN|nr:UrcA family protein [Novosphingobium chloroacetimidivorans]MBB4858940.1 UrcA family protein [Novosphingobium chloroacetimidivorans]
MKSGLVAFAALALATSASANATENPLARDKAVLNLQGLDLSTTDGQQRLAIRMDQAARSVCGDRLATVHLDAENKARECRATVVADVRRQIEARVALAPTASRTQVALAD